MLRTLTMIAACAAVASCVSVLPEQEVPNGLYRLGPVAATQSVSSTVIVREPEAPRTFAGRAIAAEGADGAIRYVQGVEWADNVTRMMQLALLDNLEGANGAVVMAADTAAPGDYEVSWRLSDFLLVGGVAKCGVEVTLLSAKDRQPIAQTLISQRVSVIGETNEDRAKALAEAGRACVSDVAAFVAAETKKPRS